MGTAPGRSAAGGRGIGGRQERLLLPPGVQASTPASDVVVCAVTRVFRGVVYEAMHGAAEPVSGVLVYKCVCMYVCTYRGRASALCNG